MLIADSFTDRVRAGGGPRGAPGDAGRQVDQRRRAAHGHRAAHPQGHAAHRRPQRLPLESAHVPAQQPQGVQLQRRPAQRRALVQEQLVAHRSAAHAKWPYGSSGTHTNYH